MLQIFLQKITAVIATILAVLFPGHYVVEQQPEPLAPVVMEQSVVETATSTAEVIATSTKSVATKKTTVSVKPVEKPVEPVPTPPIVVKTPEPLPDFEKLNQYVQTATVNILCTTRGGSLSPISGSGIIVSKDGLILTNAHIAQYFLLRDFREKDYVECVIRTGSPAYPRYHAELVYISPTWIQDNSSVLRQEKPKGSGENDFAFLRITDALDHTSLPTFNHVPLNAREYIEKGEPVVLVSYPAGFLGGEIIMQNLNIVSAITTIQDLITFKEKTIDLISVGGTVVSQRGASGGPVVDKYSSVIGIISTSSNAPQTSDRALYAITPGHISRTIESEISMSLTEFTSQDMASFAKKFQEITAPLLTKILTDALTNR